MQHFVAAGASRYANTVVCNVRNFSVIGTLIARI